MKKASHILSLLLMFIISFGISLTAGENQFYNTMFMPIAGFLGYAVYRKRALYLLPCLVLAVHLLCNLLNFLLGAEHLDIAFGDLMFEDSMEAEREGSFPGLSLSDLEPDQIYNIPALGAQAGRLTLYVNEGTVSIKRLAEILLDIRQRFDNVGIPFHSIDLVLRHARTEGNASPEEERLEVIDFPYSEIREEGLTQRVSAACEEADAYHEQQDREKEVP